MHGNITAFSVFTAAPNFLTTGVSTRLKTRKETEMSEQGYNKARALACLDRAVTALLDMRGSIERLPEVLSAKEGTDMDACDCVRAADDISGSQLLISFPSAFFPPGPQPGLPHSLCDFRVLIPVDPAGLSATR